MVRVKGVEKPILCWGCKFNKFTTLDKDRDYCCISKKYIDYKDKPGYTYPFCEFDSDGKNIVLNMSMPNCCNDCPILDKGWSFYCRCNNRQIQNKNIAIKKKPNWCPLEEIKDE